MTYVEAHTQWEKQVDENIEMRESLQHLGSSSGAYRELYYQLKLGIGWAQKLDERRLRLKKEAEAEIQRASKNYHNNQSSSYASKPIPGGNH